MTNRQLRKLILTAMPTLLDALLPDEQKEVDRDVDVDCDIDDADIDRIDDADIDRDRLRRLANMLEDALGPLQPACHREGPEHSGAVDKVLAVYQELRAAATGVPSDYGNRRAGD